MSGRMKFAALGIFAIGISVPAAGAPPCTMPALGGARTEITKRDFTRGPAPCSLRLSLYGIYLGEASDAVRSSMEAAGFTLYETRGHWLGVSSAHLIARRNHSLVKYFTVVLRDDRVEAIILHSVMHWYLSGDSSGLLEPEAGERDSPLRLRLLGREDAIHDSAAEVTYVYDSEGFELSVVNPDPNTGRLVELTLRSPVRPRPKS